MGGDLAPRSLLRLVDRPRSSPAASAWASWGFPDHLVHLAPSRIPSSFLNGLARDTSDEEEESVVRRVLGDLNPPPRQTTAWNFPAVGPVLCRADLAPKPLATLTRGAVLSACRGWSTPARFRSRILSQARHSAETMRTVFGALRHAVSRHSSDVRMPSVLACRIAPWTVDLLTPASDAMWPMVSLHSPRRATSAAIVDRTAVSPMVKRAASCGGSHPEPVQRRRRSMWAGERGREPTGFLGAAGFGGTILRAAISSASCCASCSDTAPQAKPFHTAAANSASRTRGVPGRARLMSSANMIPAPSWGRFGRVRPRSWKGEFPR